MKRQLPLALVTIFGLFMIIQFFVPHESSEYAYEYLLDWLPIIGVFTLLVGIGSVITIHFDKIRYKKTDWGYSIIVLGGAALMMFFGFDYGRHYYTQEGLTNEMFVRSFRFIIIPIQSTIFALLAFFIASASYRAFRARNFLASLLLIAALVLMLRFTPVLGDFLAPVASWLLNIPNLAAQRAIIIGVGLGMVATALKVVLGVERGYMGK